MNDSVASATVGWQLKEGRQLAGLSLKELAAQTCIRRAYLEALEADRFDLLPGEVYAQGFTRIYAHAVGLDSAPLLAQIRQLKEAGKVREEPVVSKKGGLPAILLWVLLALLVVGIAGGVFYWQWSTAGN